MPRVCRIVKTLPISAVSLPFSSSIMNRWPVPEVRASSFCVTPRPLRVSRTSLPMSRGVYFKSLTPFNKVTVREYYGVFLTRVNIVLPYGNISYHKPSRRLECSRTGTKHVPTRPAPTTKKLEALNYPVGMTRLDLILKITGADGKRKHRTPYRGNPGSPRRAVPRLSRPPRLASTLDRVQAIRTQSA